MTATQVKFIEECRDLYKRDLLHDIFPFWLKNGLDRVNGGIYTCLDRDGALMDTTKSVWFQGRFAFNCSFAYNHIEKNQEWLDAAKGTLEFIDKYCFDTDGHMFFTVTGDGKPVQKRRYVFSEAFAAIAFSEYSIATGEKKYADRALEIFFNMKRMLETPGFLPPKTFVEAKGFSIVMILLNVATCIRRAVPHPALDEQINSSINEICTDFMHPEFKAVLEMVGPKGEFIDTCAGRTINPGHSIEAAWFILEESRHRGWDKELNDLSTTILDWSWKWGWDEEFGGIINFRDCKNFPHQDYSQDMKFWWPQNETILSTLYAYVATKDPKYLDMHKQIHDYAYKVFPDKEYGEWYGYLHRDGTVAQPAKGNIFKGPFHVPRMMVQGYILCEEILKNKN